MPADREPFLECDPVESFAYELFISESKSQVYGILRDVFSKWKFLAQCHQQVKLCISVVIVTTISSNVSKMFEENIQDEVNLPADISEVEQMQLEPDVEEKLREELDLFRLSLPGSERSLVGTNNGSEVVLVTSFFEEVIKMVYCFAPKCNHTSEGKTCNFFAFPSATKKNEEYRCWIRLIRRKDRDPSKHSRVCSCHFRDGDKRNGPEVYERNQNKLFPEQRGPPPKKKKKSLCEIIENARINEQPSTKEENPRTTQHVILEAMLDVADREIKILEEKSDYKTKRYTVTELNGDVIRMETGLPTKEIFNIVLKYAYRFKDPINYFSGWKVESISFEDQITQIFT
ncbi:uncharacterized protein LOC114972370 [Acropora millepora]|uniref:uncharacterized protein LOC114972370 n=1 Tax=Acropora millepora TaxID=45264 RepID=UPI001CF19343|nr:uncharacterized protein LOC114972370 [Acropora millepora]